MHFHPRVLHRWLFVSGVILLALSIAVLAWCFWPLSSTQKSLTLSSASLQKLFSGNQLPSFLLQENRRLELNYPAQLRQGETGQVILRWDLSSPSDVSTPAPGSSNVLVEARLDLLGVVQNPSGSIDAPLFPGQVIVLQWQIIGVQVGRTSGTVWSYLNPSPAAESSAAGQAAADAFQPVGAQDIEVQIISLFGVDLQTARWIGAAGLVLDFGLMIFSLMRIPGSHSHAWKNRRKTSRNNRTN